MNIYLNEPLQIFYYFEEPLIFTCNSDFGLCFVYKFKDEEYICVPTTKSLVEDFEDNIISLFRCLDQEYIYHIQYIDKKTNVILYRNIREIKDLLSKEDVYLRNKNDKSI